MARTKLQHIHDTERRSQGDLPLLAYVQTETDFTQATNSGVERAELFENLEVAWAEMMGLYGILPTLATPSTSLLERYRRLSSAHELLACLVGAAELLGLITNRDHRLAKRILEEIEEITDLINCKLAQHGAVKQHFM